MKLKSVLAAFVVALLLPSWGRAAIVTVDVTIKAVNLQARGITVVYKTDLGDKTIDLDVSRKAEITVNGEEGTLDSLGPGLRAKVSFDKELSIVTKIVAKGTPAAAKAPELVEVSELNDEGANDHPWLSEDGLTIYWDRSMSGKGSIWTACRDKADSSFSDKKSLFKGKCPTVSSDGLEMILVGDRTDGGEGGSLQVATRKSVDKPFGRPKEIAGLQSHVAWVPCLSADGLTLYFRSRLVDAVLYSTRQDKESPWSKARPFDAPGFERANIGLSLITPDGLTLFGQKKVENMCLMLSSRSSIKRPFGNPKPIEFNGRPLFGFWPRYVPATHELFFLRLPPSKGKSGGIWVIRNFSPSDADQ